MKLEEGLQQVNHTRIIAIVRGVEEARILDTAKALLDGGVSVMEVTLNTEGALSMIAKLQEQMGDRMFIGAGTVLDSDDAKQAINAGASFLVSPNTDEDMICYASDQEIPVYPGAMTPTEIVKAWKAGAAAVKLFPSASLGLPYLKELLAPLDRIPIIAVGGVRENNIRSYLEAGCYAVGIGGSLIDKAAIASGEYAMITAKASALMREVRAFHQTGAR
ncbi:bifunctional 4-hydroxy-2-oxoglutarate aldolase/2-dehydro-3-deoxy-phosphogluconate aldolase [Paenibacillus senegalensis]|uniref:bifunctional 4-hydroxy-2-oxoglutarate aldolase/2-dehydro-3-deoxy-phosphogluconate aldolase n=1 Tax=Paenibacillus senegalensis TaxID=1465766 RepID=UPI00028929DE|nr:bifunctional 4-hydroxy-2-oxoglutarate aldolase/2-dehydro-3-deoxy-phosphogluconate aldolase [Paenibacillus senegalensis]